MTRDGYQTCAWCSSLFQVKNLNEHGICAECYVGGMPFLPTLTPQECRNQWPSWFTPGKNTPRLHAERVRTGRHPTGFHLGPIASVCRYCNHMLRKGRYLKCGLIPTTNGPGTDIRAKWRACVNWQAKGNDDGRREADGGGTGGCDADHPREDRG